MALYKISLFGRSVGDVCIDIDDIYISLKEHFLLPVPDDEICANLIVNGDAEVDNTFAYHFELLGNIGVYLKVNSEMVNGVKTIILP